MSKSIFHLFDLICHYGQLRSNWGISSLLNSQSSGLITYLSSWTLLYLNLFISILFLHLLHLISISIPRGQKYPIITCYSYLFLKSTWLISTLDLFTLLSVSILLESGDCLTYLNDLVSLLFDCTLGDCYLFLHFWAFDFLWLHVFLDRSHISQKGANLITQKWSSRLLAPFLAFFAKIINC